LYNNSKIAVDLSRRTVQPARNTQKHSSSVNQNVRRGHACFFTRHRYKLLYGLRKTRYRVTELRDYLS